MEENLSDIVRDFKLSTRYDGGFTIHFYNDPDAPPSTPQRQERWGRVRTIGNGSQGTVVLENCVQGARNFTERAVKKIPLRSSHSTRFYERELAAIIKFSHDRYSKYFVKSLGWYTSSGRLNIAMEYFPEGDLFTYVEKLHGLPEDECREITSQIVSGISLMHAERFAHRDIKPQNILIHRHPRDGRSSTWWIKLGDFGICKRDGTDTNTTNFTPGTETYMAPELLNPNLVSLSPRDYQKSDVWALGITVFFILTNTVPFSSRYSTREFATNLGEPFPCAPLRGRNISAEGQAFIRDAIKPKPEDRMDAAKAMEHAWINGFLPCCPVSGTYMETSTTTSIQSSLDEMGGLTNEILTLASQTTTLSGFLSQPSQNGSIPRPAAIPMQILHENNNATIDIEPMRGLTASLEEYWGLLVTPHKTPSFIFCDLIGKIFDHFNVSNTGMLQPHELCAFMYAARWLPQFPPIQVFMSDSPSLGALQQCDVYITNCYRWFPLDHRMATREPPPSVPIQPHAGRIRMRDQFMLGLSRLLVPTVPNGMPLLTRRGFQQYFVFMAVGSPDDLFIRLNHLMSIIGSHLKDSMTDRPFESHIPRSCFPPAPSSPEEQMRLMLETQRAVWLMPY